MKQKHFLQFPLFAIVVVLVLSGCTKQGPTGATGPQGAAGPTGPGGSKGDTGTANVIYSKWDSSFSGTTAYWNVPLLTQSILDNGVVLVYFRFGTSIFQLNYGAIGGLFYSYSASVGQIGLYTNSDLSGNAFRYVLIPGVVPSGNSIPKDYKLLCQQYNIRDN